MAVSVLIKTRGAVTQAGQLGLAGFDAAPEVETLFEVDPAPGARGLDAKVAVWSRVTLPAAPEEAAWDICHRLRGAAGLSLDGGPPEVVEPDLEQRWLSGSPTEFGLAFAAACEPKGMQGGNYAKAEPHDWFSDPLHSQLRTVTKPAGAAVVRIAHLDTGLDLNHKALPTGLRLDLALNCLKPGGPQDVTDHATGFGEQLGHGTATAVILAGVNPADGSVLGGAPRAEVVPIRVANSVVLFRNSAIVKALTHVRDLNRTADPAKRIDVVTMSMGGLASAAWADIVNQLYDQGVFIVCAAGNNFANVPTRHIVYPARFRRVVAACGVMADGRPYADLALNEMAGNYGPQSKMDTAMSAYTPNLPWAAAGCPTVVGRNGGGTSSATPQIAAAAALWIERNRARLEAYPEPWMKVEATRKALFDSAHSDAGVDRGRLGRGLLRAADAMAVKPAAAAELKAQKKDDTDFAVIKVLFGTGLAAAAAGDDGRRRMLELEALQLSQDCAGFVELDIDPSGESGGWDAAKVEKVRAWLLAQPRASNALRQALGGAARVARARPRDEDRARVDPKVWTGASAPPAPKRRRLRVFARDPMAGQDLETAQRNETVISTPWEPGLEPGPTGEYLEVVDIDPASGVAYAPVDLNHPHLLVQDGLTPSEASPQFHQQMVYAVTMKTIGHFERALGRRALWSPRRTFHQGKPRDLFVRRLRIYPHALREQNAYYSSRHKALLFGYFPAEADAKGRTLPGAPVFTCLSHDIIAHEATHALLDGLHRRFEEPSNQDVLAFHEAFADLVALFQHFTLPDALREAVAKARGFLRAETELGQLAVQFGVATGRFGPLRSAIGQFNKQGHWEAHRPGTADYEAAKGPHARGAVLVAAVFDAFLNVYALRTRDLLRLASGGTGIMPDGEIPHDLVNRLAQEAAQVADRMLQICIRALDYCPAVDINFGDYLRAAITADRDVSNDEDSAYRVALIGAFRARGIYPEGVRSLSVESVTWEPPWTQPAEKPFAAVLKEMSMAWALEGDRKAAFDASNANAAKLHKWLRDPACVTDDFVRSLGLNRADIPEPRSGKKALREERERKQVLVGDRPGFLGGIEIHSVRPARRVAADGQGRTDLIVEITQSWFEMEDQGRTRPFRGGVTLVVDPAAARIRYVIRKRVAKPERVAGEMALRASLAEGSLRANYFGDDGDPAEPFALLHRQH